jgi:hypothetical protein
MNLVFPSISTASTRLVLLTIASALLLAAGDASNSNAGGYSPVKLSAPMRNAAAISGADALVASLSVDDAVVAEPNYEIASDGAQPPVKLSQLVSLIGADDEAAGDDELHCLANAVYFESRGEPLEGQLAVAQAIINRVASGRYANTICSVIAQRGQFSFDRSRTPIQGNDWRNAVGIARIAVADMWHEIAPRAVSFHAARLSPGWRDKTRIVQIGNHIFYR